MHRWVLTAPAEPEACLTPVRDAMMRIQQFLDDPQAIEDLDLALTEACANVALHAYPDDSVGMVEVAVEVHPGRRVILEVTDQGRGLLADDACCVLPEPGSEHGRGFYIMSRCCDELSFHSQAKRHTVRMVRELGPDSWKPMTDIDRKDAQ